MSDPADEAVSEIEVDFNTVESLSDDLVNVLADSEAPIGYGMLACGLTFARLASSGKELSDDDAVKFLEHLMEWGSTYFGGGKPS